MSTRSLSSGVTISCLGTASRSQTENPDAKVPELISLMNSTLCFCQRYDVDRLVADLRVAEQVGQAHLHFSTAEHDGGWKAIALVSMKGRVDPDSLRLQRGRYEKTPILKRCRYFEEIVDSFHCPRQRVRL